MENKQRIVIRGIGGSIFLLAVLMVTLTCSAPKRALYTEPVDLPSKELKNGKIVFEEYCATCHPGAMAGVGLAIVNKPLPEFLIKFQIRNGIGVMPAFGKDKLTDKEVDNIAEYLVFLRKKD